MEDIIEYNAIELDAAVMCEEIFDNIAACNKYKYYAIPSGGIAYEYLAILDWFGKTSAVNSQIDQIAARVEKAGLINEIGSQYPGLSKLEDRYILRQLVDISILLFAEHGRRIGATIQNKQTCLCILH